MPLTLEQQQLVDHWFPGAVLVQDLSWGLIDTTVLHLRVDGREFIVKAGGPDNHHLDREITGHAEFTAPWLRECRIGRMIHADQARRVLVLEYLPGVLVEGTPAESDPQTHRQAGQLLAVLHGQASRVDDQYEQRMDARALRWLDGQHRIEPTTEARLRHVISEHERPPAVLVPTHGDWQPRNWLINNDQVLVIDLGRADWRPALSDLVRLSFQQWHERADLEVAFLDGYGPDPREPTAWHRALLREAIGTACWAWHVGDEPFEQQGHRMIHHVLSMLG